MKKKISLYIHIPFCVQKCLYCDFISYKITETDPFNAVHEYMKALEKEIDLYGTLLSESEIYTIFIGGGTPSSIEGKYILSLVHRIKKYNSLEQIKEFTIEINPGTLNEEKTNAYLAAGINRISMGLQTSNDNLLQAIGRIHSYNEFITTYKGLRNMGFNDINLDIMFGLSNQTLKDIEHTIETIRELKPEHISAYSLKLEEGTPMYHSYEKGLLNLPNEDLEREMYHLLCNQLSLMGYEQYEISNFSKPTKASKHNLVYWENEQYLGIGVASHSKIENIRFNNISTINDYISAINKGDKPIDEEIPIEEDEDLFETIMLGLRLNKGINIKIINEKYNIDFRAKYCKQLSSLLKNGLINFDASDETIKLTAIGRDLSNQVFLEFM